MDFFVDIFTWLVNKCYFVCGNYGFAIILFTFISKLILLPVSVWVQKNSIKMVKMQPEINFIKVRYFGDSDLIAQEQAKIFKREKYNPFASVIPLLIQIVLLVGVMEAIKAGIQNPAISMDFYGIDLSFVPAEKGGFLIFSPIIAGCSALILGIAQNAANVLQVEQSKWNKYGVLLFSVGLSLYLGWYVSVGVALYWTVSNLFAVALLYILNGIIDPRKYVDYKMLNESKEKLKELEGIDRDRRKWVGDTLTKRERADYRRFFSIINKHIVFYSESSGFYKYYRGIIEYLLENTNIIIHYITSDPADKIFDLCLAKDRLKAYYIGEKRLITLMMKMDADIVVMTMPDLENFHIKRSYVREDIEYIYIPHGLDSLNLTMRTGSMDHYDTVFCVGKHQKEEIVKTEQINHLPKKKLIEWGYCLLDDMRAGYHALSPKQERLTVLIAPSWQQDNIVDICLEKILDILRDRQYHIIVRPHPQHVKLKQRQIEALRNRYAESENIEIQMNFSSNSTVFEADVMLTDWSGIAYEFAYTTEKPVLFINTPMKVMNPEYEKIDVVPLNILLREEIGCALDLDELEKIPEKIDELLRMQGSYKEQIHSFVGEYVYNLGNSAEVGAQYMIDSLQEKIRKRRK